jgi:hypothetical protein
MKTHRIPFVLAKVGLAAFVVAALSVMAPAQSYNSFRQTTFTFPAIDTSFRENNVSAYHQISWTTSGTVSSCRVSVDSSLDNVTWTVGGVISTQNCAGAGPSAVTNTTAVYVRLNMQTLIGSGATVVVTYKGYATNPAGGGGAVTSVFGRTGAVVAASGDYSSVANLLFGTPSGNVLEFDTSCGGTGAAGFCLQDLNNNSVSTSPNGGLCIVAGGAACAANPGTLAFAASVITIPGYALLASPTFTGTPSAPTPGTNINTTQIPTTAWVNTFYAAKASPALTGTPTAPTAAAGTNTTQIATTAFANAAAIAAAGPLGTPANVVNSSASISAITLFTPTVSGLYKINGYIAQSAGCGTPLGGSVSVSYTWTDETGSNTFNSDVINFVASIVGGNTNVEDAISLTWDVRAIAGQPIQYSTTYAACAAGTATYNFFANVTPN